MKKLLKKLFYWDAPAHGALFSTVLFLPGSWILLSLAVLLGGMSVNCPGLLENGGIKVWISFSILEILLFFHLLICGAHFGKLYRKELVFAKRGKWQIPATICWIFLMFPVLQGLYILSLMNLDSVAFFEIALGMPPFFSGKTMVFLCYAGFLAMLAGIFCTAKIIENAARIPWKKLFGKGTLCVSGVFVITYVATGTMSVIASCRADEIIHALAETHGPLDMEHLKRLDVAGRKVDGNFWRKAAELNNKVSWKNNGEYDKILAEPFADFPEKELTNWQKVFDADAALIELEGLFSLPIPAVGREYKRHGLIVTDLPELTILRDIARLQAWRVRFAGLNKDKAAAKAALDRMENISKVLRNAPYALHLAFFVKCESYRIDAVKHYIGIFSPTQTELKAFDAIFPNRADTASKNAVAGELIMHRDFLDALAEGGRNCPPLGCYGWLLPAGRYLAIKNSSEYLQCFDGDDFFGVAFCLRAIPTPHNMHVACFFWQIDKELTGLAFKYPDFEE